jgi:hypothetical protein
MNKKSSILCFICLMLALNLFAQGQDHKNIIGFGAGISPGRDYCIYFGGPVYDWAGKNASPVFQVFYARQVLQAVRLGGYIEYESATINNLYNFADMKASRFNIGINWLAQYPNKAFHAQLGGYVGCGSIIASDLDQALDGIDFGIMIGPAYEKDNLGIALHIQSGLGWYSSSDLEDLDVLMPKILLKVYYKF